MENYYYILTHYDDVIMGTMASQITSLTIVYSTAYLGSDLRIHQRSASQMASNAELVSIWWVIMPIEDKPEG